MKVDVLGVGVVAVDNVLVVDTLPGADEKQRVLRSFRTCGGLAGTALMAASRLGVRCAYAGRLGVDDDSTFALEALRGEGVDVANAISVAGAGPVRSVVIVDTAARGRAILFDESRFAGPMPGHPPAEVIADARVLLIDHVAVDATMSVARLARKHGLEIVADFEDPAAAHMPELVELVDHLVLPKDVAFSVAGVHNAEVAVRVLLERYPQKTVVVTCGDAGAWFGEGRKVRHAPALPVNARNTAGCGDVFHGAYAAALSRGIAVDERVRIASAAAALAAQTVEGEDRLPRLPELQRFLSAAERADAARDEVPA